MFETKKTLIVVYKDELLMNQLKKLVESRDDDGENVRGVKDGSVNIVSWKEKVWQENKKAGNLQGKILFLGDIKGTDKLTPVLDIKFDEYGVKFGWAGNQAVLYADPKALTSREDYEAFSKKLAALPVPEFLKKTAQPDTAVPDAAPEPENAAADEIAAVETVANEEAPETADAEAAELSAEKQKIKLHWIRAAKERAAEAAEAAEKFKSRLSEKTEELFRDKTFMKQQMMFYGVVNLYNNGLREFLDS